MSQTAALGFLASFVLGPALAALLLRMPATAWTLAALSAATLVALAVARPPTQAALPLEARLAALWLAWVLAVTLATLALRRRAAPGLRRWATVAGLIATTLPWFGLSLAEMTRGS